MVQCIWVVKCVFYLVIKTVNFNVFTVNLQTFPSINISISFFLTNFKRKTFQFNQAREYGTLYIVEPVWFLLWSRVCCHCFSLANAFFLLSIQYKFTAESLISKVLTLLPLINGESLFLKPNFFSGQLKDSGIQKLLFRTFFDFFSILGWINKEVHLKFTSSTLQWHGYFSPHSAFINNQYLK